MASSGSASQLSSSLSASDHSARISHLDVRRSAVSCVRLAPETAFSSSPRVFSRRSASPPRPSSAL
eukprot:6145167-Pyramimonas_sp.AAC.1